MPQYDGPTEYANGQHQCSRLRARLNPESC